MPLQHERKETKTLCRISKTGTKNNKNNLDDEDSLPGKHELIAQIDKNLKHLQGQRKILQYAKEGKSWRDKFSLNDRKNKKNQCDTRHKNCCEHQFLVAKKSIRVTDSCTQIGPSLNHLFIEEKHRESPSRDMKSSHFVQNVILTNSDANIDLKTHKNRSSLRKDSSKSQTNLSRTHSKQLLSQKCFDKHIEDRSQTQENSYESHNFQNKNNIQKEVRTRSIFTKNYKALPEFVNTIGNNDKNKNIKISLNSTPPQTNRRSVDRTASSTLKHAKLSKEILEYVKKHRASQKPRQPVKDFHLQVCGRLTQSPDKEERIRDCETSKLNRYLNLSKKRMKIKQNVSIYNHDTIVLVHPEPYGRSSYTRDTKSYRKNDNISNNSIETPSLLKSQNVECIKPNVIDDSTYVCPDNSEENDYLLLPYVSNRSEDNAYLNLSTKSVRAHSENRDSLFEEHASKSVVVLDDVSSEESLKPSRSLGKGKNTRTYESFYGSQITNLQHVALEKIDRDKSLSQTTDKSEYMSHRLERTWESHANRKGIHSSKFVTSYYDDGKTYTDNRSHYPVKTNTNSKQSSRQKIVNKSTKRRDVRKNDISKQLASDEYNCKGLPIAHKPVKQRREYNLDNNVPRDPFFHHESLQKNSNEKKLLKSQNIIDAPHCSEAKQSFDKKVLLENPSFVIHPEKLSLENSFRNANLETTRDLETGSSVSEFSQRKLSLEDSFVHAKETTRDQETRTSVSEFLQRNEMTEKLLELDLSQLSHRSGDINVDIPLETPVITPKEVLQQKEEFNQEGIPPCDNNAFEKSSLPLIIKENPELGDNLKTCVLSNSCKETPKPFDQHSMKATFEEDTFPQDNKQDMILKENISVNSKGSSSTTVNWTPRAKLTYSDNEIQEKIVKQNRPVDFKSKSFCSRSYRTGPRVNAWQDHPQITKWKNEFHDKSSLSDKEKQIDLKTSQDSRKNLLTSTTKDPELRSCSRVRVNEEEIYQKSKSRQCEVQNLSSEPSSTSEKYSSLESKSTKEERKLDNAFTYSELGAIYKPNSNEENLVIKSSTVFKSEQISPHITIGSKSESSHVVDKKTFSTKYEDLALRDIPKAISKEEDLAIKSFNNTEQASHQNILKLNQTFDSKSVSSYDADKEIENKVGQSKFGAIPKMSTKDLDFKSKLKKPSSSTALKKFETYQDISKKTNITESKVNASFDRKFFKIDSELTNEKGGPKSHQSVEKKSQPKNNADDDVSESFRLKMNVSKFNTVPKIIVSSGKKPSKFDPDITSKEDTPKTQQYDEKSILNYNSSKEVSKSLRSKLNGLQLGAIPKITSKQKHNTSSISLFAQSSKGKNQDLTRNSELNYLQLETNPSLQKTSKQPDLEAEVISLKLHSDKIKEHHPQNDIKDSEFLAILLPQYSSAKINKSSSDLYSDLFLNTNHVVKSNSRTSPSNLSIPSKRFQNLHNRRPINLLQASSSSVFNTDNASSSDFSCRRKFGSVSAFNLKTDNHHEIRNKNSIKTEEPDIFNQIKSKTPFSINPSSFSHPEEKQPSLIFNAKLSNNHQGGNIMDGNYIENSSLSLNENNENVIKSEEHVFLSDTIRSQNIHIEGVSKEVSDLIQHLQNRVKDCDENVKNQLKTFEKLKQNCKVVNSFSSKPLCNEEIIEDEEKNIRDLKEASAEELFEPLGSNDKYKSGTEEENSCQCIFCGEEQSADSEEIPSFTGCDCMKEDYYTIMRIAYNK